MSSAVKIARNTSFLFISDLLSNLISFFIIVILTRFLGDVGLGKYSFAFSFIMIFFTIGSNFGILPYITREISKRKETVKVLLSNTITLISVTGIISIIVASLIVLATKQDIETFIIILVTGLAFLIDQLNLIFKGVFRSFEMIPTYSIIILIERIVALAVSISVLYMGFGIIWFMVSFIISNLCAFIVSYIILSIKIVTPTLSFQFDRWKNLILKGMPFWFTGIFMVIYFKIDTVMLTYIKDFAVAGWYEAAYKIHRMLSIFALVTLTVTFPVMSRLFIESKKLLKELYKKTFYYFSVIVLPIAAGGTFIAKDIMRLIYKKEVFVVHSSLALQVILWSLVFLYFNYLMGNLLNAIGKEKKFTLAAGLSVIVNIVLNLVLIPLYSYVGAGIATLVTEIFNFGLMVHFTRKGGFPLDYTKILSKPALATLIMSLSMFFIYDKMNLFLFVIVSASIYFGILYIIKGIGKEELKLIKDVIKTRN